MQKIEQVSEEVATETVKAKKLPAMRVIIQIGMPYPDSPTVDLLSTEEFYTIGDLVPSKVLKLVTGQLKSVVQKARDHKFKAPSRIIKP